jgi:hypothetical protein
MLASGGTTRLDPTTKRSLFLEFFKDREKILFRKELAKIHHAGSQHAPTWAGCFPRGFLVGPAAPPAAELGQVGVLLGQEIRPDTRTLYLDSIGRRIKKFFGKPGFREDLNISRLAINSMTSLNFDR